MIQIGLIGLGNVGQGVLDILTNNADLIKDRVGQGIHIKTIVVRDTSKYQHLDLGDITLTQDIETLFSDPEISIIVEMMGGEYPAYDYICSALKNKKFVVTANKEVISKHKETFFKLAKKNKVDLYFEAAVGGGIPIIRSLKVGFAANRIHSLYGILNGTTNYMLTKIEEDKKEFNTILEEAQKLGLAEADPSMDISGLDVAHKLVILAAVAFKANIQVDDLYYEGIEHITLKDIEYAKELGYAIKLLAIAHRKEQGMSFKVHPTMVPLDHPLASVKNEVNAAYIVGNAVGEAMLSGKGAGGSPTGSAVISDIIDIAFDSTHKLTRRNLETNLNNINLIPLEDTSSQFYLRLLVDDSPSVLEKITGTLGRHNISISKVIQKEIKDNQAEVVIVTHSANEKNMATAITEFTNQPNITHIHPPIRVSLEETA